MQKVLDSNIRICCIGAGYVGGPSMVVIADKCPEILVNVVDINPDRIKNWNDEEYKEIPIFEPNLLPLLKRTRGKNLFFSTDVHQEISLADIIFICVNTPTKQIGVGAGRASNLQWLELCAREIATHAKGNTIVVEKSTVPVKTAEVIKDILIAETINDISKEKKYFSVLSNPEFLSEGNAIKDLQDPDRILIGGDNIKAIDKLSSIYEHWVPKDKIIKTNLWSSELSKLTANAFLAQRISSINSISALCEITGADIKEVSKAIGGDKRIGNKFISSGPGFGGSCFKKDLLNLTYLCEYYGLSEVALYWNQVLEINNWQQKRISKVVIEKLFRNISGKKIAIFGFAFKADTNDTRESPSINICMDLINEGAVLKIHDPKVKEIEIQKAFEDFLENNKELKNNKKLIDLRKVWNYYDSLYDASKNVDAILILTEWSNYKTISWEEIYKVMRKPAWVFDTRLVTNPDEVKKNGIKLWVLGQG